MNLKKEKENDSLTGSVGGNLMALCAIILFDVFVYYLYAVALTKIYSWYIPTDWNLPTLTIQAALGILLIQSLFSKPVDDNRKVSDKLAVAVARPVIILGLAYILKIFI